MLKRHVIFQSVFGDLWEKLPNVMKKRYANRSFTNDRITVEGVMNIELSLIARILTPFIRAFSMLTPYCGNEVPVIVHFESSTSDNSFSFNRIFKYPGKEDFHSISKMLPLGGNKIIEIMKCGIGWYCEYLYDGKKVILNHKGYKLNLFGKLISLPVSLIVGKGYAEEEAIDDQTFKMYMHIQHPILGKIYSYQGIFKIIEVKLSE
jgi:hypothetical protein